MTKNKGLHTFVICAYKESPYLDECVKSLLNQTLKSEVIISTSTPNKLIKSVAKKNGVKLVINKGKSSHIKDFAFAYSLANTKYVTLCHQDDVYYPEFAKKTVEKMEKKKRPLIAFTNYYELRNGETVKKNSVLTVKRIINTPLKAFGGSRLIQNFTLSLGNAICAPTVTYNKKLIKHPLVETDFKSNIDWISYIEFTKLKGNFVYIKEPLLARRIHEDSLTTSVIANKIKSEEDFKIFNRYWPKPIAKLLLKVYSKSEDSNNLK